MSCAVHLAVVVRFDPDDPRGVVAHAQWHAEHGLWCFSIYVKAVAFGEAFDVFLAQQKGAVGGNGVFGEAVAEAAFGKAHVAVEIFIDIIRKMYVVFGSIIEGNKKVLCLNSLG